MINSRLLYPGGISPEEKRRLEHELYWLTQDDTMTDEEREELIGKARRYGISEDVIGNLTARPKSKI